ncbi:hypothetical protein VTO42DRAFT_5198 [Malbranchea cinnamomea]
MASFVASISERALDDPADCSGWSRREDLQGIMGPPAPMSLRPFINSSKGGTAAPDLPQPLFLPPDPEFGPTTTPARMPDLSLPSWLEHRRDLSRPFLTAGLGLESCNFLMNPEQDAWSPLRITGLPPNQSKCHIPQPTTPISAKASPLSSAPSHDSVYNLPSDPKTQINGYLPPDSGHGTRSTISSKSAISSVPMDFRRVIRPFPPPDNSKLLPAAATAYPLSPFSYSANTTPRHHPSWSPYAPTTKTDDNPDQQIVCNIPSCRWVGKCPSDKRKHMLRHEKPFRCDEPGCKRKTGFGTLNDLERHKKCVHGIEPSNRVSRRFKCFADNCSRSAKIWPRYDNFRQHLLRVHDDMDIDELLRKSNEWFESTKQRQDTKTSASQPQSLSDGGQGASTLQFNKSSSLVDATSCTRDTHIETVHPATLYRDSRCELRSAPDRLNHSNSRRFTFVDGSSQPSLDFAPSVSSAEEPSQKEQTSYNHLDWTHINASKQLPDVQNSNPTTREARSTSPLFRDIHLDRLELPGTETVTESAMGLLRALEKEMENISSWKQGSVSDIDRPLTSQQAPSFFDLLRASGEEERQFLQDFVRAGLKQLSNQDSTCSDMRYAGLGTLQNDDQQNSSEKSFKCKHEGCGHRTKRMCEMRKHEIRHRRPYGCTFANCNKRFGSKNDWKRHENARHFQPQSWHCQEQTGRDEESNVECGQSFSRRNVFVAHLRSDHGVVTDARIRECLRRNRIGRNGQARFWCGFCKKPIELENQGLKAWDERFDHIDGHFKAGKDIAHWVPPPHADVLKQPDRRSSTISDETSATDRSGHSEDGTNDGSLVPDNPFSFYPSLGHVTQTTSYERGGLPTKRARTSSNHATSPVSPSGYQGHRISQAPLGVHPAGSVSTATATRGYEHLLTDERLANKRIADSLMWIDEKPSPPEIPPKFIICCNCVTNERFLPQYQLYDSQHRCAICNHEPCKQCTKHYGDDPLPQEGFGLNPAKG